MLIWHTVDIRDRRQHLARVDFDAYIGRSDAHRLEEFDDRSEQLDLRRDGGLADDVHVPLVVLALAAALDRLEAPALRHREPLDRLEKAVTKRQDHARERRCHLGAQRDALLVLVDEVIHLVGNLFASLALVEFHLLQHGRIVLLESEYACRLTELVKQPVADPHVLRKEVACARWRLVKLGVDSGGSGSLATALLLRFLRLLFQLLQLRFGHAGSGALPWSSSCR
mmetsp:Transcript_1748/g.4949  ORF Transcript_1748/g.4949 Transcript_1748/m.4949 type:complete len:226 (-) Transcript_1748:477-1154(-)